MLNPLLESQIQKHFSDVKAIPEKYAAFLKDISESYNKCEAENSLLRKASKEYITLTEDASKLIMNAAFDAIICIDVNEQIVFWNPQAEKIFGWKEEEVKGISLSESIIPARYRDRHKKGMKYFMQTGRSTIMNRLVEITASRRDGTEFPIELSVINVEQNESIFFCAFIRDISERKKAEHEIKQSNERFNLVSKATNDVLWDWDLVTGKVFRGSEGLKKVYGFDDNAPVEDINDWVKQIHPDDREKMEEGIKQILEPHDRNAFSEEYRFRQQNGDYAYVLDRGYIVRDKSGKAIRMIGAAQDITERKTAELQIAGSELRYRLLFEQNLSGIYQTTTKGNILNCNEAFVKMLGYDSTKELLQTNAASLYFSDTDRYEFISELRKQRKLYNYEATLKRKDGSQLHVLENISLLNDPNTGEEHCYGILVDITDKKKISADLQHSYEEVLANELLLKNAEKLARFGSWHVDMIKGVTKWSDETCHIYGYNPKECSPSFDTFLKHVHPDDLDYVKTKFSENKGLQELNFRIIDNAGNLKYIRAEHVIEYDNDSKPVKMTGFNMDVTEQRKLEQKLQQERIRKQLEITEAIITAQEKERNQLGAELHDNINQILATARLYIECAIKDHKLDNRLISDSKDFVTTAMEEIRKLSKTLIAPTLGQVALKEAISDLLENISLVNEIQFITAWSEEVESIVSEKLKLTIFRIVQEQLNNIVKHASAKVITITITPRPHFLRVTIKDDGTGFDTSKKRKGVGLQNIISRTELCNGTVAINSASGKGCELIIDFPINAIPGVKS